jgi:hypothetical protein
VSFGARSGRRFPEKNHKALRARREQADAAVPRAEAARSLEPPPSPRGSAGRARERP